MALVSTPAPAVDQYERGALSRAGTLGHLTAQETALLRALWRKLLEALRTAAAPAAGPGPAKRSVRGLQAGGNGGNGGGGWFGFGAKAEDVAYRQTVHAVAPASSAPPEFDGARRARTVREAFWAATLCDHPDVLVLRFLRARKWKVDDALQMLLACLRWRVDEEIDWLNWHGESALNYALLQRGIGALRKTDRLGQPVLHIPVRLNDPSAQPREQIIDYTIYLMEVARIHLRPPAEKVCLLFDTTDMSVANMDWTFFKTFLNYLEHYYPECLGLVLIYNASWVFYSLWKLISPLLDPVVASKVHFASSPPDLQKFIAPDALPVHLGGTDAFKYEYALPTANENYHMRDDDARSRADAQRAAAADRFEAATAAWAAEAVLDAAALESLDAERARIAADLAAANRSLDKHIRARTLYHRIGVIDDAMAVRW
ncbi:hypothetical protein H4R18_005216 [Coemansia javaensis]|uniref:CRAL-TRIO domain-containing protein n=1 Tax=Coemansia javaensis TaxID=2761396 RepID=A0A9W8H6P0_9FUNG|nr:hypothetical protein H4R18_005216 [Coemansia javaensis]